MTQNQLKVIGVGVGKPENFRFSLVLIYIAAHLSKIVYFSKKKKNKNARKTCFLPQFESKWTGNVFVVCSYVDLPFECRSFDKNTFLANFWSSKVAKIAKMTKIQIFLQNLHKKTIFFPNFGPNGLEMGLWHDFM